MKGNCEGPMQRAVISISLLFCFFKRERRDEK